MWKSLGLAIVIAVCILFISACAPTGTPIPTPAPAPPPTEAPKPVEPAVTPVPMPTEPPKETVAAAAPTSAPSASMTYPQPNEVILAGPSGDIRSVVATAAAESIELTRIGESVPLSQLRGVPQGWTMELYRVSDKTTTGPPNDWERVGDVVAIAYDMKVLADPNYLVASDSSATPEVEFSPHHPGESAFGEPHPGGTFEQQWAFGPTQGIGPLPTPSCSGATKVFVFDTPSQNSGLFTVLTPPIPIPMPAPAPGATPCGPSSHGLFVSGLIKQVAPGAQIGLLPVLDDCGAGTLQGIDLALFGVLLKELAEPVPSVLNLSLGVQEVEPTALSSDKGKKVAGNPCPRSCENPNWPQVQVQHLCLLDMLLCRFGETGGVIVAAAGNHSAADPTDPKRMQLPAAYEAVIGVAGSNMKGARSCFSNFGKLSGGDLWVSAPAGEGAPSGTTPCAPAVDQCSTSAPDPNCPYAVVGPVYTATPAGPGYAYWSGTSFAAPLVSGLAACVLASCSGCSGSSATTKVFNRIECGASPKPSGTPDPMSPGRVISVPTTLSSSCP